VYDQARACDIHRFITVVTLPMESGVERQTGSMVKAAINNSRSDLTRSDVRKLTKKDLLFERPHHSTIGLPGQ